MLVLELLLRRVVRGAGRGRARSVVRLVRSWRGSRLVLLQSSRRIFISESVVIGEVLCRERVSVASSEEREDRDADLEERRPRVVAGQDAKNGETGIVGHFLRVSGRGDRLIFGRIAGRNVSEARGKGD